MFHATYQPNRPGGSEEVRFKWFLPYMGMGAILNFDHDRFSYIL